MARQNPFEALAGQPRREHRERPLPGAARQMIGSLEELADLAERGQNGGVIELDHNLVDPSPFPDRLPDDDSQSFENFKKSMIEEGQQVPIQVRPHPTASGRYQVIYGHRRLRAAKELAKPVKAIVTEISDQQLAIAQGIENAARQDLSWIERALFAKRMEDAGVKSRDVQAALSIDRAELARLRGVGAVIPVGLIEAIGRAPKIGRPRWQELAKLVELHPERLKEVQKMLSADSIVVSDARFQKALEGMRAEAKTTTPAQDRELAVRISAATLRGKAFAKFIESRLPALMEEFEKGEN